MGSILIDNNMTMGWELKRVVWFWMCRESSKWGESWPRADGEQRDALSASFNTHHYCDKKKELVLSVATQQNKSRFLSQSESVKWEQERATVGTWHKGHAVNKETLTKSCSERTAWSQGWFYQFRRNRGQEECRGRGESLSGDKELLTHRRGVLRQLSVSDWIL